MEKNYCRSSHAVYDLKHHVVWITKDRKPVLRGPAVTRVGKLIREICRSKDVELLKGRISRDQIHLFVSVPPHISARDVLKSVKGKTSRTMLMEFKTVSHQFWADSQRLNGMPKITPRHKGRIPSKLER